MNDSIHSKGIPKPSRRVREERAGCEGWGGCNMNRLQNKTISKRTHLSSIFISHAIEPLLAAFRMILFIRKVFQSHLTRAQPRNIEVNVAIGRDSTLSRISRIRDSVESRARAPPTRGGRCRDDSTYLVSDKGVDFEGVGRA